MHLVLAMNESDAIYTVVIGVGALIAVMAPIIKLNTSITRLTALLERVSDDNVRQDKRLETHGKQIDNIVKQQQVNEKLLDRHELRISRLEEKEEE